MFDKLTSELLDLTATTQGEWQGRSLFSFFAAAAQAVAAAAAAVAAGDDRRPFDPASAGPVVPPRRGRRPARVRARSLGRRPREGGAVRTLLPPLLPLLDGSRTLDDLAARLGESVPARDPRRRSTCWPRTSWSSRGPDLWRHRTQCGWSPLLQVSMSVVAGRLAGATVRVVGAAGSGDLVARLLHADEAGEVRRLPWDGSGVDLAVVAPDARGKSSARRLEPKCARARPAVATGAPVRRARRDGRAARRSGRISLLPVRSASARLPPRYGGELDRIEAVPILVEARKREARGELDRARGPSRSLMAWGATPGCRSCCSS